MDQLLVAVFAGCLAILLGVMPMGGLLDVLESFQDEIEQFRATLYGLPPRPQNRIVNRKRGERFKGQFWFAFAGAGLILIALVDYLVR